MDIYERINESADDDQPHRVDAEATRGSAEVHHEHRRERRDQGGPRRHRGARRKLRAVEDKLLQPTLAEGDAKSFRGALKLYLKFVWLQAEVSSGGGDVAGNADFRPTQPQLDVYKKLTGELDEVKAAFKVLYERDVPAFGGRLGGRW